MAISWTEKEIKRAAKRFIDANVHDGQDRSGCNSDWAKFTPDELQELVDDLIDYMAEHNMLNGHREE